LNETLFSTLDEARALLAAWCDDYNRVSPSDWMREGQKEGMAASDAANPLPLLPAQCATVLVLDDAGLKEVLLLLEIHDLAHPWERVFCIREHWREAELAATPVCD
jgi:hypothetical protein